MHDHATVAEEEYLQTIFWLQEAGLPMTGANVARAMQLSAPTVHEMIGRLERDGYVSRAADKALYFTDSGREHAEQIVRRHRLIERFLTDILEIPWDEVHEEAERLEHWMSPQVEAKMMAAIGDAKTCPHGHPINPGRRVPGVPLADVVQGGKVKILRFENEAEELLHLFKREGLEPGRDGVIAETDDESVSVDFGGDTATLTRSVAETVTVKADPSPPERIALPEQLVLSQGPLRQVTSSEVRACEDGGRNLCHAGGWGLRQLALLHDLPQAVERVVHLREPRVERGDAEPDRVGPAEVGRHARLEQRAGDRPRLRVAQADVRAAARRVARACRA